MTNVATIVFKSGIAVDVPMGAVQAQALLDGFDESWDEEGPQIALPMTAAGGGGRLIASEIAGILVSADEEADAPEDDDDDDDDEVEDEDEDDTLDDERDEANDDAAEAMIEDQDDLADAEAGKVV